jgi:hypothetical protein
LSSNYLIFLVHYISMLVITDLVLALFWFLLWIYNSRVYKWKDYR